VRPKQPNPGKDICLGMELPHVANGPAKQATAGSSGREGNKHVFFTSLQMVYEGLCVQTCDVIADLNPERQCQPAAQQVFKGK
jgi:hypothetical protein